MTELFDHATALSAIPHEPGCYLMRDREGTIIYIGKAKDLKNRVRNYFQASGDSRPFVRRLPLVLGTIETIITGTEKEALMLEATLIKRHKPRYNVALKEGRSPALLRVTLGHEWPRVELTYRKDDSQSRYFGPYYSSSAVRETLDVLNKHFGLRTCTDAVLAGRSRPCLQYQIKLCPGPCVFDIDREAYSQSVEQTMLFLEGRSDELLEDLEARMFAASEAWEFERAATFRDQLATIRQVLERQQVVTDVDVDRDVFGFYREAERVLIHLLYVRAGRLQGARAFPFKEQEFPDEELLSSFLGQLYQSGEFIPDEVLLPMALEEGTAEALAELLGEIKGRRVAVLSPQRGEKAELVQTAQTNARHAFEQKHNREIRTQEILEHLRERLDLQHLPTRMECYDISNFQGDPIVASQVVFLDGEPSRAAYRRYRIKEVSGQDDFASMREVLTRRLTRVVEGRDEAPHLIVIDGGKGQLGQAIAVLEDLGLHETIDVISLAKSRVDRVGFESSDVTRSPERVFLPGRKNPVVLRQNSDELFLLQRIRDEAHETAVTYHKKLRRKATLRSSLDDIPGVGLVTKRALLRHFGSLQAVKAASVEALGAVKGVGEQTARNIYEAFHDEDE